MSELKQCQFITLSGKRCKNKTKQDYCCLHSMISYEDFVKKITPESFVGLSLEFTTYIPEKSKLIPDPIIYYDKTFYLTKFYEYFIEFNKYIKVIPKTMEELIIALINYGRDKTSFGYAEYSAGRKILKYECMISSLINLEFVAT